MIMAHAQPTAKSGWKQTTLKDSTDLITCGVAARPEYVENGIPFLSAKNVKHGEVIWHDHKFVSLETHEKLTKHNKPQKGDILYTRVGSFGEAAIIESDIEFSIFVSLTLIKPKDFLLNTFLKYYLNSPHIKSLASRSISGSGVGNLNVGTVRKFPIAVPPLAEQERIVAILDEAFQGIAATTAQAEKNLHNARELFQSVLQSTFSQKGHDWVETTLGEACEIQMGQSPNGASYNNTGDGVPLINGPVEFGPEPFSKTLKTKFTTAPTKMCKAGDLILCVRGSTTGRMNLAGFDSCIGRGVASLRSETNQEWVNQFINLNRDYIFSLGSGATFPNVSAKILADIAIPIPPPETQQAIVEKLDALSEETKRLEAIYERKKAALTELKQSLLQKAFAGEL